MVYLRTVGSMDDGTGATTFAMNRPRRPGGRRTYVLHVREPHVLPRRVVIANPVVVRIGSHPENDVVLHDDAVSRIHCEIAADDAGFRIRDLDSTNGTFIQGHRVVEMYLGDGAVITVGRTELRFEPSAGVTPPAATPRDRFGPLIGASPAMSELFGLMQRAAESDATVLIQGESGTGKELIAQALHEAGGRAGGPFIVFDCSSVPQSLVESELFGHERGAFTGATDRRVGCLQEADGGTLFLDEIGELPLETQPKLLRALENREVRPLGSTARRAVDVRFVAATHRNLAREVNRGTFREDLYYRLAVLKLYAPALRERRSDIPLLVRHMVDQAMPGDAPGAAALYRNISSDQWARLTAHRWRGNVRQLRNVIDRAVAMSTPGDLDRFEISSSSWSGAGDDASPESEPGFDLERPFLEQKRSLIERFERAYLLGMLDRHGGNFSRAAKAAGLDRMYFKRLVKKYDG